MSTTSLANAAKCTVAVSAYLNSPNNPGRSGNRIGFYRALMSPQNGPRPDGERDFWGRGKPTSGASCTYQIRFVAPVCTTPGNTTGICTDPDAGVNPFKRWDFIFDSNDIVSVAQKIPESWLVCSNDTLPEITAAQIARYADNIMGQVELNLLTKAILVCGRYRNDAGAAGDLSITPADTIQLNIFSTNGNAVQPVGWTPASLQMLAAGAVGRPMVVGGYKLQAYIDSVLRAGVVNNGVADPLPFDFFVSSKWEAAVAATAIVGLDPNSCMVFAPGEFHAINYYDNVVTNVNPRGAFVTETHTRTLLTQTIEGGIDVTFDWEIKDHLDCKEYWWNLYKTTGLFYQTDNANCDSQSRKLFFKLGCGDPSCPGLPPA